MSAAPDDAAVLRMLADMTYEEVRSATGFSRGRIYGIARRHGARKTEERIRERQRDAEQARRETLAEAIGRIETADALDHLSALPSASIDMVLTSPPYNVAKPYLDGPSADRISHMRWFGWITQIVAECARVLKPGGVLALQVGSTRDHLGTLVPIDLLMLDVITRSGLTLRNRVVWEVPHGLTPRRRLAGRHETVLYATLGEPAAFNPTPARTPQLQPGKKAWKGPRRGEISGHPLGAFPGDVWRIPSVRHGSPERTGHPAQMPEELARRLILVGTMPGDVVLDPFAGAGTTAAACIATGRRFAGCDLGYEEMRERRLAEAESDLVSPLPGVDDAGVAVRRRTAEQLELNA